VTEEAVAVGGKMGMLVTISQITGRNREAGFPRCDLQRFAMRRWVAGAGVTPRFPFPISSATFYFPFRMKEM
jgi:hypothetical protein